MISAIINIILYNYIQNCYVLIYYIKIIIQVIRTRLKRKSFKLNVCISINKEKNKKNYFLYFVFLFECIHILKIYFLP